MISLIYNFRLISKDNEKIRNRQGRYFLSKKYKDFEKKIRDETKKQYRINEILTDNLDFQLTAYFTSKVHSDSTNLFKGVCDSLQGIIYKNDKQIKQASVKVYEDSSKDFFTVAITQI